MKTTTDTTYSIIGAKKIDPKIQCGGYLLVSVSADIALWPQISNILNSKFSKKSISEIEKIGGFVDFKSGTLTDSTTYVKRISPLASCIDSGSRNCPFQEILSANKKADPNLAVHLSVFTLPQLTWDTFNNSTDVEQYIDDLCFSKFGRNVSNPRSIKTKKKKSNTKRLIEIGSSYNPFDDINS